MRWSDLDPRAVVERLRQRLSPERIEAVQEALEATDAEEPAEPPTLLEWSVRGMSLLLVLLLLGYVVWVSVQPPTPIHFEYGVEWERLEERDGAWVLPVTLQLRGEGVQDLTITAELADGEEVIEEVPLEFPLMGQNETEQLELWFEEDPRDYTLRFNVGSYKVP